MDKVFLNFRSEEKSRICCGRVPDTSYLFTEEILPSVNAPVMNCNFESITWCNCAKNYATSKPACDEKPTRGPAGLQQVGSSGPATFLQTLIPEYRSATCAEISVTAAANFHHSIHQIHTHTTVLWPFFRDHPGEPVPEENFWTLWCNGRLTDADTPTIRLGTTPSGLTTAHLHHPPILFYRPDALPATQPTVSKH